MKTPWIMFAIGILILLLLVVAIYFNKGKKRPTDYYALFTIGIIWLGAGIAIGIAPLWIMGMVFIAIGGANKDKWKKNRIKWKKLSKAEKKVKIITIIGLTIILVAGVAAFFITNNTAEKIRGSKEYKETTEINVFFPTLKDNEDFLDCGKTYPLKRTIVKSDNMAKIALEELFKGPTSEEINEGCTSHMIDRTNSYALKRIFVKNGTAYLDWLNPIAVEGMNSVSSSCGSVFFMAPIEKTLTDLPEINKVVHAIDGNPEYFYNLVQMGCEGDYAGYCDPTPFQ
ncbi:GerMN domain-containing protein [Candidatus Peregrinibacteria bacterium]|nr:GerMN domain-containing protein [Candidatus Peregrinibacteria bacterium]